MASAPPLSSDVRNKLLTPEMISVIKQLRANTTTDQEIIRFLKDPSSLNTLQQLIPEGSPESIKANIAILERIKQICKRRVAEGEYINTTLGQLRADIQYLMYVKNEGTLSLFPDIVSDCYDQYCLKKRNCFRMNQQNGKKGKQYEYGDIMQHIIERALCKKNENANDILVALFCVFNWDTTANNPPPTPYIEINNLTRILKAYGNIPKNDEKNKANTRTQIADAAKKTIEMIQRHFKSVFDRYKSSFDAVTTLTGDSKFQIETDFDPLYDAIVAVEKLIKNHNESTAIGTLDFVDHMSKFNTISHVCKYYRNKAGMRTPMSMLHWNHFANIRSTLEEPETRAESVASSASSVSSPRGGGCRRSKPPIVHSRGDGALLRKKTRKNTGLAKAPSAAASQKAPRKKSLMK